MRGGRIIALGASLALAAVAFGAFGAHGLRSRVRPEMLTVFETGVRYHLYHAMALVLLGLMAEQAAIRAEIEAAPRGTRLAAWCFGLGILLFSGSLYGLVLLDQRWLGAVTPLGGVMFMIGWAAFAMAALRRPPD